VLFVLVFVSRDFEFGRKVSQKESTVSAIWGYFLILAPTISLESVKQGTSNFVLTDTEDSARMLDYPR